MRKAFICSLCLSGILGGALYLDPHAVTYRTNKLTVDARYRNLVLPMADIQSLTWKRFLFPIAAFRMSSGEIYRFIIFRKKRFCKYFDSLCNPQK